MLYQNPLKIARERISHQISRKVRMEEQKDGTKSSILETNTTGSHQAYHTKLSNHHNSISQRQVSVDANMS